MIGKVLNGRYKIVKKIGTGGMAIVYQAKDQLLERKVAVKVLQPHFADNETAVNRFNHEAQAVASLSHPNIVNIFDIGRDDDIHYIVMEHIIGKDLKKLLKEMERLDIKRSIEIAKGICNGLIKAHRNNIIHCDIKPHNILLTNEGRVKVTDFGIARAITSATIGQTDSVMGSAHYLSPEQAKGSKVSTRSDIYSLGIVLYEMLTGKVPFTGENHVSIALKHIEEEAVSPQSFNSNIPDSLNKIVLKAIAKDPSDRYNSVVELLRDLKEFRTIDQENGVVMPQVNNQETMVMSKEDYQKELNKVAKQEEIKVENTELEEFKGVDDVAERKEATSKDKKGRKQLAIILLAVVLAGGLVLGGGYYLLGQYVEVEEVKVPNLIGKHFETAKREMLEKGLKLEVYYNSYSQEIEKDHIISQSIRSGKKVKKNRLIEVVISEGAKLSKVPDLKGVTLRQAEIKLEKIDLEIGQVIEEYNNQVPKGEIIKQTPQAGIEIKSEAQIDFVVSKGGAPQAVAVPNLVGLRKEEAVERLRERNLILGQVLERESLDYREGRVIAQQPSIGSEIIEGSTVQLIVSSGIRNPHGSEVRSRLIRISVPAGANKRIQITVKDDNGERTIYDQLHEGGQQIKKEVILVGPAVIRVYFDGQLYEEKRL